MVPNIRIVFQSSRKYRDASRWNDTPLSLHGRRDRHDKIDASSTIFSHFLLSFTGITNDYNRVEGLKAALEEDRQSDQGVCSIYDKEYVHGVQRKMEALRDGHMVSFLPSLPPYPAILIFSLSLPDLAICFSHILSLPQAIFTQPPCAIKCGGAPFKIMALSHDNASRRGCHPSFHFVIPQAAIFGIPFVRPILDEICQMRKIGVHLSEELVAVRGKERVAVFKKVRNSSIFLL